jgi:hypothetical protein
LTAPTPAFVAPAVGAVTLVSGTYDDWGLRQAVYQVTLTGGVYPLTGAADPGGTTAKYYIFNGFFAPIDTTTCLPRIPQ